MTGAPPLVTLAKHKRPRGVRTWRGTVVAEDEVGTWVFTPAGSAFVGDDGLGRVATVEVAQDASGRGRHSIVLLPRAGWFVAHWVLDSEYVVHVDIATPPVRSGDRFDFDDLELDPLLLRDGTVLVDDEDEFEAACAAGLVLPAERDAALAATDEVVEELRRGALVALGTARLTAAVGLALPPC